MHAYFVRKTRVQGTGDIESITTGPSNAIFVSRSSEGIIRTLSLSESSKDPQNFILKAHERGLTSFHIRGDSMTASDTTGEISLRKLSVTTWSEIGRVNRNNTVANTVRMSGDERVIAAGFEDGALVLYTAYLEQTSSFQFKTEILLVEWSRDSKTLLVGFAQRPYMKLLGADGTHVGEVEVPCMEGAEGFPVSIECSPSLSAKSAEKILAAFSSGRAQLMTSPLDAAPVLIDCRTKLLDAKWNPRGTLIAFLTCECILFFTDIGLNVSRIAGGSFGPFQAIAWNQDGRDLFVSVGNEVAAMRVSYECLKGSMRDSYFLQDPDSEEKRIVIINREGDMVTVPVFNVMNASSWVGDSHFAVLSSEGVSLVNQFGVVTKLLRVRPMSLFSHRGTCTLLASGSTVVFCRGSDIFWSSAQNPSFVRELSSMDQTESETELADRFVAVSVGVEVCVVARESGVIHIYDLYRDEKIVLARSLTIGTRPDTIFINCDDSQLAVIDINNLLLLVKLNDSSCAVKKTSRSDCWDLCWALDDACTLACIDRNRLYVLRDGAPEEPLDIGDDLLMGFDQLVVSTLGRRSDGSYIINRFPCKALRDCCEIVFNVRNIQDGYEFGSRNPHPRIWETVAEGALLHDPIDVETALKCFQNISSRQGVDFVSALTNESDPIRQRMLVFVWLGRLGECDAYLESLGRTDLLIDQKRLIRDYDELVRLGIEDIDAEILADHYFETARFKQAAKLYVKGRIASANLPKALLIENNYGELVNMVDFIESGNPLLSQIGDILLSSGLCDEAVRFFIKAGDPNQAISACVRLNRWDLVATLEARLQPAIRQETPEAKASKFIQENEFAQVFDLIRQGFATSLLPDLLHKCIFSDESASTTLKKKAAVFLASCGNSGSLQPLWRQAEIFHLWNLTVTAFYKTHFSKVVACSLRLLSFDEDLLYIPKQELLKMLAVSALVQDEIQVCSSALSALETDASVSASIRDQIKELASHIVLELKGNGKPKRGHQACRKCNATDLPEFAIHCYSCGDKLSYCVRSGRTLFRGDSLLVCQICHSRLLTNPRSPPTVCPLCHTPLPK